MSPTLPRVLAFVLSTPLAACLTPPMGSGEPELMTSGGHIVDSRAWAVGTEIRLQPSWDMGFPARVRLEGDGVVESAVPIQNGVLVADGGGLSSATIVGEGSFDAVLVSATGEELSRTTLQASEPDGFALGLVLDDCPEFPDLLLSGAGEESRFIDGAQVTVALAPVDAEGRQLLGHFDYAASGDGVIDYGLDWGSGLGVGDTTLPLISVGGVRPGELVFTAFGEDHRFPIGTVSADEIDGLDIHAQAEKHGADGESLLTVLGLEKGGAPIAGVDATWSTGGLGPFTHASSGSTVEACVGETCVNWEP